MKSSLTHSRTEPRSIVEALKVKLTRTENRYLSDRPIQNVTAFDFYLRAKKELMIWSTSGFDNALRYLESCIEKKDDAILFIEQQSESKDYFSVLAQLLKATLKNQHHFLGKQLRSGFRKF